MQPDPQVGQFGRCSGNFPLEESELAKLAKKKAASMQRP